MANLIKTNLGGNMKKLFLLTVLLLINLGLFAENRTNYVKLDNMTVTGTGTQRNRLDTPIPTKLVTKADIVKKGAFSLYDALDGVPGVRVEQQCSYCNFTKVRIQGMASGNTKILINGLPLFTGLAGVYGLQQYLAANIDSIEIVKGAGSSLYGGDAVAGVINIIPAGPTGKDFLKLTSSFETHNSGMFTLSGSKRSGDWGMTGSVQRSYVGVIDENGDNLTDRVDSDNFAGNVALFWYNPLGIFDRISFFGSAINETRMGGNLENNNWQNPFAESSEKIQTKRFETGMNILKKITAKILTDFSFAFSQHKRDATNDAAQDDIFNLIGSISNASQLPAPFLADEKLYITQGKISAEFGNKSFLNKITFGLQYKHSDFEQDIGQLTERAITTKEADDFGVYIQDEISLNKVFEIVAGVRLDYHDSAENYTNETMNYDVTEISPRLALSYKPVQPLLIRASVGTGFRVPYHFSEDLHLCSGSPKVYKGSDLKAEDSVTFSGGIQYTLAKKTTLNIDYSCIKINNKLDFVTDASTPSGYDYSWKNLGGAISHGVDLLLTWQIKNNLNFSFDLSWVKATYDENPYLGQGYSNESKGDNVMRTPSLSGGITVDYSPGPFDFTLNLKYTGSMYISYDGEAPSTKEIVKTPDFLLVNFRAAVKASKDISIFAGVKNLFDYVQTDKRPDDAAFMWGPYTGREIYGGASIKL